MSATKTKQKSDRAKLTIDRPVYEELREEAERQGRTIKRVGTAAVTAGLAAFKNEQYPAATGQAGN